MNNIKKHRLRHGKLMTAGACIIMCISTTQESKIIYLV